MSIATLDDIASGLAVAQEIDFLKIFTAPKAAGAFQSGWLASGRPGAGSAPPAYTAGSGYACDKSTNGAAPLTNAVTQLYAGRLSANATLIGTLILFDRLWSCGGMGFAAGTYAVTTPGSLPARITDNGVNVEAWVEQFVAAGAASGTLTLNYLNANTGAAKSGVISAVVSAPVAGQLQPIPLAVGDTGVRQVTSAVTSATWTSGSFGITLMKRVAEIPVMVVGGGAYLDWAALALARIPNDACLMFAWLASGTTAPTVLGELDIIDK